MSGALLLGLFAALALTDLMLALVFRSVADRAEADVGRPPAEPPTDPASLRKMARMLFVSAPIVFLVGVALSFGLVPIDGIVSLKF
ncbi:MAG: hypothetical protein V4459_12910 [Pseudomonadota bacterium]